MTLKQYLQDCTFKKDYPAIARHAKGLLLALEESLIELPILDYLLVREPIIESVDWNNKAYEIAKEIPEQYDNINKAIKNSLIKHTLVDDLEKNELINTIYDDVYQEADLWNCTNEQTDSRFIYNSLVAVAEALDCIDQLRDYEDSGIERDSNMSIEEVINRQATYTLANAVMAKLESYLKEKYIPDFISEQ